MFQKNRTVHMIMAIAVAMSMVFILASCSGNSMVNKPTYLSDAEAATVSNYYKVLQTGYAGLYEAMNVVRGLRADGKINDYQKGLIVPKLDSFKSSLSKAYKALGDYLQARSDGKDGDMATVNLAFNTLAAAQDLVVQAVKSVAGADLKALKEAK